MRSAVAIAAGGLAAAAIYMGGLIVTFVSLHGIPLGAPAAAGGDSEPLLTLPIGFVAGLAGGWIAARVAQRRDLLPVKLLACALGIYAWWGFTGPDSDWPAWYGSTLGAIAAIAVVAGGLLHRRARR